MAKFWMCKNLTPNVPWHDFIPKNASAEYVFWSEIFKAPETLIHARSVFRQTLSIDLWQCCSQFGQNLHIFCPCSIFALSR